jgi:putative Ca2+/H+ antiporter (TMEM165/GDT1 family)
VTVFVAEIGDKTQLATVLFATDPTVGRLGLLITASGALVMATALGVLAGTVAGRAVSVEHLRIAAGFGFIAIGIWTLLTRGT